MFFDEAHIMGYFLENFLTLWNLFLIFVLNLFIGTIEVFILIINRLTFFAIDVSILISPSSKLIIFKEIVVIRKKEAGLILGFHIAFKSFRLVTIALLHSIK